MTQRDAVVDEALELLRGGPLPLRSSPQAIWARAQRTAQGPSAGRQVFAFVAAAAVGMFAVVALMPARVRPAPVVLETRVDAVAGAKWSRSGKGLVLERGTLNVVGQGAVVVRTPLAVVETRDATFSLEAGELHVRISAAYGSVRVLSVSEGERVLRPGDSWVVKPQVAPAAQLPPAELLQPSAPAPRTACGAEVDCLARAAKGNTLAAQLALFDLGVSAMRASDRAGAVRGWREYVSRFPDGVLAPEAQGGLVRALVTTEPLEALREAELFHARFGDEPSAGGVELLRAHLLRDVGDRFDEGCALYEALTTQASLSVRTEALFQSAMCLQARGDAAGARSRLAELKRVAPGSERVKP